MGRPGVVWDCSPTRNTHILVSNKRHGQTMSLNNGGDTIDLVDLNGEFVHTVSYTGVQEGEVDFSAN